MRWPRRALRWAYRSTKAKRLLGWAPRYADYRAGLAACLAQAHVESDGHAAERQHDA